MAEPEEVGYCDECGAPLPDEYDIFCEDCLDKILGDPAPDREIQR